MMNAENDVANLKWSTNQYFLLQPSIKTLFHNCAHLKGNKQLLRKKEKKTMNSDQSECNEEVFLLIWHTPRECLKHNLDWNYIYKLRASIALHTNRQSSKRITHFSVLKSQLQNTLLSSNFIVYFHIIICTSS